MEREKYSERYEIICNKMEESTGLKEGVHVRYTGITDAQIELSHYCGGSSNPRGVLDFDTIYEIECMVIARSYWTIKLVGFGEYMFNALIFEAVDKSEKKKCLKAGGRVRYNGSLGFGASKLIFENIYEVEKVERDRYRIGYTNVKLVGFEEMFDRGLFEKVAD